MEVFLILLIVGVVLLFYKSKNFGSSSDQGFKISLKGSAPGNYESDKDSWEGSFWDASDPKKITAHVKIDYVDGGGSATTRKVLIRKFDNLLHGGIIIGHCQLRDAIRTFRFDRIKSCIDLETGEVIKDINKYLTERYEKSPERSAEILTTEYIDVLKVIYFIAKADGQYRKEEKEVITMYVRKLIKDNRITTKMIDGALNEINIPTMHGFKLAFGRVLKGGDVNLELLSSCCQEIVDTQKTVHPAEKEALEYIEKKLSNHK